MWPCLSHCISNEYRLIRSRCHERLGCLIVKLASAFASKLGDMQEVLGATNVINGSK